LNGGKHTTAVAASGIRIDLMETPFRSEMHLALTILPHVEQCHSDVLPFLCGGAL
jgi:hypothetical protein